MRVRKQSTSTYGIPIYMVLSSDHVSAATGKTVSVTLSKNGGAFAAASGSVSELSSGVYMLAGNATDTNTLGSLVALATATGCDPFLVEYTIVPYDPFDSVRLGMTALPNAAAEAAGGLYTRGSGAGQINQDANGRIDVNAKAWIGGTIPAVNVTGVPKVDVVDWNGSAPNNLVNGRVDAYPTVVQSGTAQTGASTSITLSSGASATDSLYVGELVYIHSGTGAGQVRIISAYVGSTKVATVAQAWATNPDATSVYAVLGLGRALVDSNLDKIGYTASTVSDKTGYSLAVDQPVNVTKFGGTVVTARDIGASVLLSAGTGAGQLDFTSGVVKANLVQILTTALTETAGQIAGAFKQFFNVATPTGTVNSLPNANPGANGGVPTVDANNAVKLQSGTGANQISLSSGTVTVGTNNDKTGYTASTVSDKTGYALTAGEHTNIATDTQTGLTAQGYTTTRAPYLDTLNRMVSQSGTAQAGAAGSITLAAGASATDSLYNGQTIVIYGGTGAGQARTIFGYVGATKVASVSPNWTTTPDATSTYLVLAMGRVTADVVNDKTGYALTQTFPTNFSSLSIDGSGRIDLGKWLGSAPNALQSGRIDSYLGAVASGVIAAASFAAGALDAVWSTATRTLTAFAFNVTVGDIVAAALAKFFSTNSGTTYASAVSGSVVKEIASNASGGGSSPSTIAAAVWDEPIASHLTAGSTGNKLNSAASAGDPWTTTLPGSYTGSQAGAILPAIKTKTDSITGQSLSLVSPLLDDQNVYIVRGDDYKNADGRALFATTTFSNAPSLSGGAVVLRIKNDTSPFSKAGVVTGASTCYVELTTSETAAFLPGNYAFDLQATLSNGDIVTIAQGKFKVLADVR